MNLQELFQRLSYGPFSNVAVGNEGTGEIVAAKQPAMVHYANEGLLRLHTRFMLVEKSLVLKQVEDVTNYELTPDNTYTASVGETPPASPPAYPYIQDTEAVPFENDLIKILRAFSSGGYEIPLNNENDGGSYYTPQNHILQVPYPTADELTYIIYQARHKKLDPANLQQSIVLPPTLEEALISYIAYLFYSSMNGAENVARSAEYLSRYNSICLEAETRGIVNSDEVLPHNKLNQRGFV